MASRRFELPTHLGLAFGRAAAGPLDTAAPRRSAAAAIPVSKNQTGAIAAIPGVLGAASNIGGARLCLQDQPQQVRWQADGLSYQPTWVWLSGVLRLVRWTQPRPGAAPPPQSRPPKT
jgi:hypothetical protein